MKAQIVRILFFLHIAALIFGLVGLLLALPHPEWWSRYPVGTGFFLFGIHYAGSLHILFGAATVLLFGCFFVGVRKTLLFFMASTAISLGMELLGTSTGFPFGPYAYTDFLGYKILGHVPFSIPLSWFYMGFTAYVLASQIVTYACWRRRTLWSLVLGAYFLTVWDLSLDPAMASSIMPVRFWVWYTPGPYFGMPVSNLVGWTITGLIYMSVSRLAWRENLTVKNSLAWLPFSVYAANTGFAIVLALNYGLWPLLCIALLLGLAPAALVFLPDSQAAGLWTGMFIVRKISRLTILQGSRALLLGGRVKYRVDGLEYVPKRGPVVFVSRHFHHLYDGCLLLSAIPRTLHILIALDWIQHPVLRALMEKACAVAEWPVVLRGERLRDDGNLPVSAYRASEQLPYLRQAVTRSVRLLRRGRALLVFPEAYPVCDPSPSPRDNEHAFFPFRTGFARLIELAEQNSQTRITIVPVGLDYTKNEHWTVVVRFGQALSRHDFPDTRQLVLAVEQNVQTLSCLARPDFSSASTHVQEVLPYEKDRC